LYSLGIISSHSYPFIAQQHLLHKMLSTTALSVLLCLVVTATTLTPCPNLGAAASYAIVSYSGVTNVASSVITGAIASYPIGTVTGFPPASLTGCPALATPAAEQAQIDLLSTYSYCESAPYTEDLTGIDLAGKTLTPGVYKFASTAGISAAGVLTFNGAGIYIFQVGSAITTGAGIKMVLKNGATAGCIFWQVGSSVTHGASSTFLGNILAYASVTFGASVTYKGSIYAQTGDVTLIADTITIQPSCNVC
jgi:type VI secretion system secreted protein VgrG